MIRAARRGVAASALSLLAFAPASAEPPAGGGGAPFPQPGEAASAEEDAALAERVRAARERLSEAGLLPLPDRGISVTFEFPLRSNGIGYFSHHGTSFYVDQDQGSALYQDWNCGTRSFDQHKGTDFFTFPYPWLSMDLSRLEVVAAAAGTIVGRVDGGFDRSCTQGTSGGNQVILQHADGSISGYLHLKNGSVTAKIEGESVAAGEYLGVVGSSGGASGPHLHFTVFADDTLLPATLRDPFNGPCESMTGSSLWVTQPAERQPRVSHISTNALNPIVPACPAQEITNEKRFFDDGHTIYFVVFVADEGPAFQKTMQIKRPDGTIFDTWFHTAATTSNAAGPYFWTWPSFPAGGQAGRWTFSVAIDGVTRTRAFWIDAVFADDFEDANLLAWSASAP